MIRSGEKAITTIVRRTSKGQLEINLQVHPIVEEFFQVCSGGETTPVALLSRTWMADKRLEVYNIPASMCGTTHISGGVVYSIDRPGTPLMFNDPASGLRTVNLSFIRLVGSSQPGGVTFSVTGVFEKVEVEWFSKQIVEAGNAIYQRYIRPMVISTSNTIVLNPEVEGGLQEGVR